MQPPIPLDADATLFCSAETFVLLMSGRVEIEPAVREGLISVAGDEALIAELARGFAAS